MSTNSGDPSPSWEGVFGACDVAKPRPAVPNLREVEAAGNTSDVDVDQQPLSESLGGDSLPDVPLANVPLPGARPDGSVGEE